jgi:preprotein translocase subunit SecA
MPSPTPFVTTHIDPFTGENDAAGEALPDHLHLTDREMAHASGEARYYGPEFDPTDARTWMAAVARNSLCPCGSGQKFKHCHGQLR